MSRGLSFRSLPSSGFSSLTGPSAPAAHRPDGLSAFRPFPFPGEGGNALPSWTRFQSPTGKQEQRAHLTIPREDQGRSRVQIPARKFSCRRATPGKGIGFRCDVMGTPYRFTHEPAAGKDEYLLNVARRRGNGECRVSIRQKERAGNTEPVGIWRKKS